MSNFRQCFDEYLRGSATLDATAKALTEDLQREPGLIAVHGAFIEATYRVGTLSGEGYEALMRPVNAAQVKRETPAPASDGDSGDKTVLRPGKRPLRKGEPVAAGGDSSLTGSNFTGTNLTGTNVTTGSTWSDPAHWTSSGAGPIGTGSIVKARFVLEEPIGKGGMGTVYKARDLRKEEAQDRNPYVAIKTLNEDFKRHPQALRALQREARKAQALAHPNIVTVYDFDRDGTDVYMVMELLEGESLDRLIKRSEGVGIGSEQTWRVAIEICRGMAFAHQRGIVHADFKPANVFLTKEGAVKIFDFGIARAVKRGEREGAFTVFDPATLGALTPAYASCEVIEGLEPDARDDVYAIGCVIYELLTGTHPFKRMSADVAKEAGAVPVRPAGLSWWRWRALRQSLDFRREQRPASAATLLDAFRGRVRPTTRQLGIAAAAVAVVAAIVLAIAFVPGMLAQGRESNLLAALSSADRGRIETVLPDLRALEAAQRSALLLNDGARTGLIRYFKTRIDEAIDGGQGRYNYTEADSWLRELQGYLSDSLAVRELADRLAARKNEEIGRQREWLDQHIERGVLISEQGSPNVIGVLDIVRSIDPNSRLLSDPRLPGAFAQQTRVALQAGDTDLAEALVTRGLSLQPNDAMLVDLRDQVKHASIPARQAPATVQNVSSPPVVATEVVKPQSLQALTEEQLRSQLAAGMSKPALTLIQARQLAEISKELSRRGVADAITLERALKIRLANDALALKKRRGVDAALAFAEASYALYPDSPVLNKTLAELREAAVQRDEQRQVVAVERIKQNIESLLASELDDSWPGAIEAQLQQLAASVPTNDTYLTEAKQRTAALYVRRAIELRRAQRVTEAGRMLERGREMGADPASVLAEEKMLTEARAQQQLDDKARARAAQLTALKEKLLVQAQANQMVDALYTLEQLRPNLPKKDKFVTDEAPRAIAQGYLRLASATIKEGRFKDAINLVDRARDLDRSDEIAAIRKRYTRYQSIDGILANRRRLDTQELRTELAELAKPNPDEATVIMNRLARTLVTRINTTQDVEEAARLAAAARVLFMPEVIPAKPVEPGGGAPAGGTTAPAQN